MEASALRAPVLARRPLTTPLLRLRSDEQLVALFRAGSEEAFTAIHDRYRQRLFGYVRQMLAKSSRADAEDVLQDVFVRAYGALRVDTRDVHLRAWLYRVSHNRCIDHLRRPVPPAAEVFELSRTPLHDPIELAQRREDLKRLVADVGRLPEQQRSALLMREIDGLAYADIAGALDVTVPAVKSLLVRARMGLVEAIEARETDCAEIRQDLLSAYDRRVKASSRARRHMRECDGCREYRGALRDMRRSFASLSPVTAAGPLAVIANLAGWGGGAAGAGGIGAGAATACKVAAVVCGAALATGTVAEVSQRFVAKTPAAEAAEPPVRVRAAAVAPVDPPSAIVHHRTERPAPVVSGRHRQDRAATPVEAAAPTEAVERTAAIAPDPVGQAPAVPRSEPVPRTTGGSSAPAEEELVEETPATPAVDPVAAEPTPAVTEDPLPAEPTAAATPPASAPPPEH